MTSLFIALLVAVILIRHNYKKKQTTTRCTNSRRQGKRAIKGTTPRYTAA